MKPSQRKIKQELKKLRAFMESRDKSTAVGILEARAAYIAEHAIRWATEDTVDWPLPVEEAKDNALIILRAELEPLISKRINAFFYEDAK